MGRTSLDAGRRYPSPRSDFLKALGGLGSPAGGCGVGAGCNPSNGKKSIALASPS
jgi:hypothetical protein